MADAPYLIALALLEQGGRRAMPLQGKGLRQPLAVGEQPLEVAHQQGLELLLRVWQRSEEGPLRRAAGDHSRLVVVVPIDALQAAIPELKAAWIRSGDTPALLRQLTALGSGLWALHVEPRGQLQLLPLQPPSL